MTLIDLLGGGGSDFLLARPQSIGRLPWMESEPRQRKRIDESRKSYF